MYNSERRKKSDSYCELKLINLLKLIYSTNDVQIESTNKLMDIYTGADYFCVVNSEKVIEKTFFVSVRKSNKNYNSFLFRLNYLGFELDKLIKSDIKYHIQFSEENGREQIAILNLKLMRKYYYDNFNLMNYLKTIQSATNWNESDTGKKIVIKFNQISNKFKKVLYL